MTFMQAESFLNQYAIRLSGEQLSFYVHYWGVNPAHFNNPLHKHSFFEICYVVDGEGVYVDEGKETHLTSGTLFLSRPEKWHQIKSQTGLHLLFVAFEMNQTDLSGEKILPFHELYSTESYIQKVNDQTPAIHLWDSLLLQASHYHPFQVEMNAALAYSLLLSLCQTFIKNNVRAHQIINQKESYLHRAKLYIKDNLSQPLQLNDLACYLHISTRHLSRLFSTELGESFTTYIQNKRMRKAVQLLLTTNLSIKEIADQTGFTSVHYFTRIFKKEVGEPPGQYRKKYVEKSRNITSDEEVLDLQNNITALTSTL